MLWYFHITIYCWICRCVQARGPKKHLKRLNAPKAWMLDKLGGVYAPRPSTGPHKLRECLPLVIFLRNRLKYALTGNEVLKIVKQRLIKVDGKVRTDPTYPAGFMGEHITSLTLLSFPNSFVIYYYFFNLIVHKYQNLFIFALSECCDIDL